MTYYAHTAEDSDGHRLPESSGKWQPLADHLRNVANLTEKFAIGKETLPQNHRFPAYEKI